MRDVVKKAIVAVRGRKAKILAGAVFLFAFALLSNCVLKHRAEARARDREFAAALAARRLAEEQLATFKTVKQEELDTMLEQLASKDAAIAGLLERSRRAGAVRPTQIVVNKTPEFVLDGAPEIVPSTTDETAVPCPAVQCPSPAVEIENTFVGLTLDGAEFPLGSTLVRWRYPGQDRAREQLFEWNQANTRAVGTRIDDHELTSLTDSGLVAHGWGAGASWRLHDGRLSWGPAIALKPWRPRLGRWRPSIEPAVSAEMFGSGPRMVAAVLIVRP